MTKAERDALEKVCDAEANGNIPVYQSKAKVFKKLAEAGLIEEKTIILGGNGRIPVEVTGYAPTIRGRIAYTHL